jgi:iron complex transport system permease protein
LVCRPWPESFVKRGYWIALAVILAVLAFTSLFVGVTSLMPWDLFNASEKQLKVFFVTRIPRLIAILTSGASMSVVGLIMQQLARNKFVSPSTAGTIESATFGVLVATIWFGSASIFQKTAIAFVFALVGTFIFMQILEKAKYKDVVIVPLVGIMFGNVVGSITTFFALKYDLMQSLGSWMTGNFATTIRGHYELLYIAVPLTIVAYIYADRFTVVGMGADFATNLGLNYRTVMNIGLAIIAMCSAVVVLTVGSIPFLGLIVPNVATILLGDNLRKTVPFTAMLGMVFVLACDIAGRLIRFPYEIPIGLVVGVVGSVIFLFLIMRRGVYATSAS